MLSIDSPLSSAEAYAEAFAIHPPPVLRRTVLELEALSDQQESITGREIAGIVLSDPLMTLRVLIFLESHRRQTQNHDITTIERAIMMMGIQPFFNNFAHLHTVEELLSDQPQALIGLLKVVGRARRAAHYAHDWAVLRHDLDVDEITVAALLYEITDALCWCIAPNLRRQVYELQRNDPQIRTRTAQRVTFGCPIQDIQLQLVKRWQLPELLVKLMDIRQNRNPRVRTVLLANNLARHTGQSWGNPAIPDDLAAVESLLKTNRETLLRRLNVPEAYLHTLLTKKGNAEMALSPAAHLPPEL